MGPCSQETHAEGFFAHSLQGQPLDGWQPLAEHLQSVGAMSAEFAKVFGAADWAHAQGLLHDLGKYTTGFQRYIKGQGSSVDHSTAGARVALARFGPLKGQLLAYGIAGHHAGLANGRGEGERTSLVDRLAADLPPLDTAWQQELALPDALSVPPIQPTAGRERFQLAFLARMLFSCLVDADFLDTEAFYRRSGPEGAAANPRHRSPPSLLALRKRVDTFLAAMPAEGKVNALRREVLAHVRGHAKDAAGLFSLTVPTGGGKTLASLAFALDHAIQHGLRRVIFVIPFTSIVEQNAAVFRRALGDLGDEAVLEHHSAFVEQLPPRSDPEKYQAAQKLKLAMENWDVPIVVTTAVQFFESLFAARPSQCRKLHNIAGSVVILDEAQTMPLSLLRPCVAAIDELARNYKASVVLCTATQPALEAPHFEGGLQGVRELAPEKTSLFRQLERVRVRHLGTLDDDALAAHMREREQVLCIVNNRRHARAVYLAMVDLPGARHLSTLMCARHRSAVLADVRQRLKNGEPCRLVSTSLIEAGVDVDFPTVLRAEAGLDSIAQAAGRCNREGGRALDASEVLVFATANADWAPPQELKQYADKAREVLRLHADDPLSPQAIERYFRLLYWQKGSEKLDVPNLMGLLRDSKPDSLPLETLAAKFRMIDEVQMPVIVPYAADDHDNDVRETLKALQFAEGSGGLARRLQPYVVQLPARAFNALRDAGAIQRVAPEKWGEQFWTLAHEDLYDDAFGLRWDNPSFIQAGHLTW